MTTHPTRAEWWREVTDLNEVIPAGCPARAEWPDYAYEAYESIKTVDRPAHYLTHPLKGIRVFIDSRWTPPRPAYKVGDVITEFTDETLPADGVAIVDIVGDVGQLEGTRLGWACGGGVTWGSSFDGRFLPFTVIYVPKRHDQTARGR